MQRVVFHVGCLPLGGIQCRPNAGGIADVSMSAANASSVVVPPGLALVWRSQDPFDLSNPDRKGLRGMQAKIEQE